MVAMLADNAKRLIEMCDAVDRLGCPIADVEKEALVIALIRSVAEPMASGRGPSHAWCSGFAAADGSCRTCGAIALGDAMREQMIGEMRGHACARLESVLAACVRHCGGLAAALRRMRRVDVRGDDGDAVELDGAEVWRGGWALDGTSLVWRETYAHGCPEDVSAGSQP